MFLRAKAKRKFAFAREFFAFAKRFSLSLSVRFLPYLCIFHRTTYIPYYIYYYKYY